MSASEMMKELPKLTRAERKAVLKTLLALEDADTQPSSSGQIDLHARRISETQAADLRSRLKTFAEDWARPEAAIYDEDPAR
jgi:hypothetical protein